MNTLSLSIPHLETRFKIPDLCKRYGIALGTSLLAFGLTYWLKPIVKSNLFDFFQGAVVLTALYAGLGPALMTAGISIFTLDYFFIPPLNTLSMGWSDCIRLTLFAAVAVVTSSLSAKLKQAKSDLQFAHDDLEKRIEKRTHQLSLANTRLEAEVRQRREAEQAILEISNREQQRLGQDLHDGLCQILAGVRLLSEELKLSLAAERHPQALEVAKIETRLTEALTQADTVSRGLYPVELETNGLMAALQELANRISILYSVTCRFHCLRNVLIQDSSVATHLFRIAQEAVTNAIKGGRAKQISMQLRERGGKIILSIHDNGRGYPNPPPRQGMGLKIMAYRARMIDGILRTKSRVHHGTRVTCWLNHETR